MTCLICGAKCVCKKAEPGLCCGCHRHKVRKLNRIIFQPELGVSKEAFDASLAKHKTESEQKLLEFPNNHELQPC